MTKLMELELMSIKMVLNMRVNGLWINNMVKEENLGQMDLFMKEIIFLVRNQERVSSHGLMEINLKDNSKTTSYLDMYKLMFLKLISLGNI
jgi:hypothetical protein